MKSFLLNTVLASVALAGPAFAIAPEKYEDIAPKYKNRLSVSPNSVGYERIGDDSMAFSFEYAKSPTLVRSYAIPVDVSTVDIKLGYTFAFDNRTRFTPHVGGNYFTQETSAQYFYPTLAHGAFGVDVEYDACRLFTVGLNTKGLIGGRIKTMLDSTESKEASWGMHAAMPVTFRFGTDARWDARFEPFALLLKDYANYVGGKATLGYRY